MKNVNPFSGVRASDYSDDKINSLWVEFGPAAIEKVIEPHARISKFILGGKGSGKTHLLRYHSYPVARLRSPAKSGLQILCEQKYLAVFLRALGIDSARFNSPNKDTLKWQKVFGTYLELRLTEKVVEALLDVKKTSPLDLFDDYAFINEIAKGISAAEINSLRSMDEFLDWIIRTRKQIDEAVNNSAFSDEIEVNLPFNLSAVVLGISKAIGAWHQSLVDCSLIYLIDEIENFSASQQEVVNTFIRYGEGQATFRVTGRLYALKSYSTMGSGEHNRGDSEYKTEYLDEILRNYSGFPAFARKFVAKHLYAVGALRGSSKNVIANFDPKFCFEEIDGDNHYRDILSGLNFGDREPAFIRSFGLQLERSKKSKNFDVEPAQILDMLTVGFPILIKKLNFLLFSKKLTSRRKASEVLNSVVGEANDFVRSGGITKNTYSRAYGHYAADLFAQLFREAKNGGRVPYAGFETFVKMAAGNPRNLLIVLGRAYDIALYRQIDFINDGGFPIGLQTDAALEAADFAFEKDASFGTEQEQARLAVRRLATLLRTARYSLKIPEVSPSTISFAEEDLTNNSSVIIALAKHHSFLFDIAGGRPDRNSQRLNKKLQLNPMMAPKWGLPLGRRGDLKLNRALLNAIFDPLHHDEFDKLLKQLEIKWNTPFKDDGKESHQDGLF
jgi:hypothetical protein